MIPVPGHAEGTPYGARSTLWSCRPNAAGQGIHTGVDFPAPIGTTVVTARPGTAVYADHGSAFGYHQLEIRCTDGTRDFYAHMEARTVADGAQVTAGHQVGRVGAEGNVTGPHLHFERHTVPTGPWSCAIVTNPQPSVDWEPAQPPAPQEEDMPLTDAEKQDIADRVVSTLLAVELGDTTDKDKVTVRNALNRASTVPDLLRSIKTLLTKKG